MMGRTYFIIFFDYFATFIVIGMSLYCGYKLYRFIIEKETIFSVKSFNKDFGNFLLKYKRLYNIFSLIIIICIFIVSVSISTRNLPELKNILTNNYETIECTVSYDSIVRDNRRSLNKHVETYCVTDDNDGLLIKHADYLLKENDRIIVKYFRRIEVGEIVKVKRHGVTIMQR